MVRNNNDYFISRKKKKSRFVTMDSHSYIVLTITYVSSQSHDTYTCVM